MSQTFPEFVREHRLLTDERGLFARYYVFWEPDANPAPTWQELLNELGTTRGVHGVEDGARLLWQEWSGEAADPDEWAAVEDAEDAKEENAEWFADEADNDGEEDEDDEEWLDNETFGERLGNEPAGSQPRTGYDDSDLDGCLPDEV